MRKGILRILLTVFMLVGLIPMSALATEGPEASWSIDNENYDTHGTLTEAFAAANAPENGGITYVKLNTKVEMDYTESTIPGVSGAAGFWLGQGKTMVLDLGSNEIISKTNTNNLTLYGIRNEGNLSVKNGTISVYHNASGNPYIITSSGSLNVAKCTLKVEGDDNVCGIIYRNGVATVTDCKVDVKSNKYTAKGIDISTTAPDLTIGNCDINASGGESSYAFFAGYFGTMKFTVADTVTAIAGTKAFDNKPITNLVTVTAGTDQASAESADATLKATYTGNKYVQMVPVPQYIITFKNEDGTVLQSGAVYAGEIPSYTGEDPIKAADTLYNYTFNGWTPEIGEVIGEATYTATYQKAPIEPTGLTATYGDTLNDVMLPTGWGWKDATTSVGDAGEKEFTAVFSQTTDEYYEVSVTVMVSKATTTDYTVPTGLTATYGDTLAKVTLPTGWTWKNATTSVGNIGENKFTAVFTPEDAVNYNTVEVELTVKVVAKPSSKPSSKPKEESKKEEPTLVETAVAPTVTPAAEPEVQPAKKPVTTVVAKEPEVEVIGEVVVKDKEGLLGFGGMLEHTADQLTDILVSDVEKQLLDDGTDIYIYLENTEITDTVVEEEKELITAVVENIENAQIGVYIDINLYKQIGDKDAEKITNTDKPLTITLPIPQELINTNENVQRTYFMVRVHDGKAEIIDSIHDEAEQTLTFSTDRFSTYAIGYSDVVNEVVTEAEPAPEAQQEAFPWWIVVVGVAATTAIVAFGIYNRKKED